MTKLKENIEPLLLGSTPPVLTIGRRCMDHGYSFVWPNAKKPYFICPDGKRFTFEVDNYTPWLVEREGGIAFPSVAGSHLAAAEQAPAVENALPGGDNPSDAVEAVEEAVIAVEPSIPKPSKEQRLRAEAVSLDHLLTHTPKNPYCISCMRGKMQQAHTSDRSKQLNRDPEPTAFGENVTADHFFARDEYGGRAGPDEAGLVVYDRGTEWIDCFPVPDKSGDESYNALNQFAGPKDNVQLFYSDNAPELLKAAKQLGWKPGTSTPGRPETNGVGEAAVKRVTHNTTTVLDQAGLSPEWWPFAARHYCFSHNIVGKGASPLLVLDMAVISVVKSFRLVH